MTVKLHRPNLPVAWRTPPARAIDLIDYEMPLEQILDQLPDPLLAKLLEDRPLRIYFAVLLCCGGEWPNYAGDPEAQAEDLFSRWGEQVLAMLKLLQEVRAGRMSVLRWPRTIFDRTPVKAYVEGS